MMHNDAHIVKERRDGEGDDAEEDDDNDESQVSGDGPRFLTDSDTKTVTVAGGNDDKPLWF